MIDLHDIANRSVFHTNHGLFVESLPDGAVRVFRAGTGISMYYTQEKGFHHPETELAIFDKNTWNTIVDWVGKAQEPHP